MSKVKLFWEQAGSETLMTVHGPQSSVDMDHLEFCGIFNYCKEHVDGHNKLVLPEEVEYKNHGIFTSKMI